MPGIGSWLTKRELLSGDREAVVERPRRLTYRELNRRVNRLAIMAFERRSKTGGSVCLPGLQRNRGRRIDLRSSKDRLDPRALELAPGCEGALLHPLR